MGSWFITILWCGLLLLMDTNTDNFVNNRNLDQSVYVSWKDIPDWEEGLGEFLLGFWNILTVQHSGVLPQPTRTMHQPVIPLPLQMML